MEVLDVNVPVPMIEGNAGIQIFNIDYTSTGRSHFGWIVTGGEMCAAVAEEQNSVWGAY